MAVPERAFSLTSRELQVLELIVRGLSSREIAQALKISFKTAVSHRSSVMGKLGVKNTASLVREAFRTGLISLKTNGVADG